MNQLFEDKRLKLVYESVLKDKPRFSQLLYQKRAEIQDGHSSLLSRMHKPFLTKFERAFAIVLVELPPFQKAWIFFSLIIPILILIKIEGAQRAAWILPLIFMIYLSNQLFFYQSPIPSEEINLFPSEQIILNNHLNEPLSSNILEQRQQLLKGWNLYIIKNWAQEEPSSNDSIFSDQLANGLFAFNIARIKAIQADTFLPSYLRKKAAFPMMLLLGWNVFFAWFANRRKWFENSL